MHQGYNSLKIAIQADFFNDAGAFALIDHSLSAGGMAQARAIRS